MNTSKQPTRRTRSSMPVVACAICTRLKASCSCDDSQGKDDTQSLHCSGKTNGCRARLVVSAWHLNRLTRVTPPIARSVTVPYHQRCSHLYLMVETNCRFPQLFFVKLLPSRRNSRGLGGDELTAPQFEGYSSTTTQSPPTVSPIFDYIHF